MKIEIWPSQPEDLLYILARAEPNAARAVAQFTPQEALRHLYLSTIAETGFIDGEPVSLWALQKLSLLSEQGLLWMVNTPKALEHPFAFARRSRVLLDRFLTECPIIIGFVQCDFAASIRWMKWLGFTIGPVYTWNGVRAHYCERRA